MLIYSSASNINNPYASAATVDYKNTSKRRQSGIRAKASKRNTQQRRPSLKANKKKTSLNAKNVKFLKTLGFKVKQNWASKCKKR